LPREIDRLYIERVGWSPDPIFDQVTLEID